MLDASLQRRLLSLKQLPVLPAIASEALELIEDPRTNAAMLGKIIEQDQALTARVLHVANSPFYGFPREISTIDLAVVLLGFDAIREIILSLAVQGLFARASSQFLDIQRFWQYSVFCGAAGRFLARKLGYRLAGEAFVAGLMHDIGVLIIGQFFQKELQQIRVEQKARSLPLLRAEYAVLGATHCDIGAWLAEQWNLPEKLIAAIAHHHDSAPDNEANEDIDTPPSDDNYPGARINLDDIDQPLTAITGLAEWFAVHLGFKDWAREKIYPQLYVPKELFAAVGAQDMLTPGIAVDSLKPELLEEFEKASALRNL